MTKVNKLITQVKGECLRAINIVWANWYSSIFEKAYGSVDVFQLFEDLINEVNNIDIDQNLRKRLLTVIEYVKLFCFDGCIDVEIYKYDSNFKEYFLDHGEPEIGVKLGMEQIVDIVDEYKAVIEVMFDELLVR